MANLESLDERFNRARSIREKLAQYDELERQYEQLEARLHELEQDPDVRRALGFGIAPGVDASSSAGAPPSPSETDAPPLSEAAPLAEPVTTVVEPPLSPHGRLKRGFLDRVFPKIAERRFGDWTLMEQMRTITSEELKREMHKNSVKAVVIRLVASGLMEVDRSARPFRFRFKPPEAVEAESVSRP